MKSNQALVQFEVILFKIDYWFDVHFEVWLTPVLVNILVCQVRDLDLIVCRGDPINFSIYRARLTIKHVNRASGKKGASLIFTIIRFPPRAYSAAETRLIKGC